MNKIVLIAHQGSGTNLLRSFLNSHPDIVFYDELFVSRRNWKGHDSRYFLHPKNRVNDEKLFLDKIFSGDSNVIGFDLKYNQANEKIIQYIKDNGVGVLHLLRDPARTFVFHLYQQTMTFNKGHLDTHIDNVMRNIEKFRNLFSESDYYKEVYYEDMTRGWNIKELPTDFEDDLLGWLGVDYEHLTQSNDFLAKESLVMYGV